jgi:Ca-activated chloride channel family protein
MAVDSLIESQRKRGQMKRAIVFFGFLAVSCILSRPALSAEDRIAPERTLKSRGVKPLSALRPPGFFPMPVTDVAVFMPPNIKVPENESPIELVKIDILVTVSGLESETATTMTFRNPNGRVLEGNLEFPLPSDASVTGYALDVNGTLVDGVIVPKEKARVVLETEMRKGIDPGILEHVAGNFFRTRIYPVPALGTRLVRVVSVAPLSLRKGDAAMHIPIPRGAVIPNISLEVRVKKGSSKPLIGGFGNLNFTSWTNEWVAKANLRNVTPDNDLFLSLPQLPEQVVALEKFQDEYFASVSAAQTLNSKVPPAVPQKIRIAWDASGSRDSKSVKKDVEFLRALFKEWPSLAVELTIFRNRTESPQSYQVKGGQADALFAALEQVAYDGGTSISTLNFGKKSGENSSPWLVFTDGFESMREDLPKFDSTPLHVVSSASMRNVSLLRFLAEATGGTFVDLAILDTATAVHTLTNPKLTLLRVENPVGDVDEIQSRFLPGSGRASVYAKFKKDTKIQLVFGANGQEILRTEVMLKKSEAAEGQVISRAWAAARAMELAVFAEKNEQELVALGRKYHLVTPGTSLIVLERVDQYLTYEIEPPQNMPQWREQYFALLKNRQQIKTSDQSRKIDTVLSWWSNRIRWWETKHEVGKDFKYRAGGPSKKSGGMVLPTSTGSEESAVDDGNPTPMSNSNAASDSAGSGFAGAGAKGSTSQLSARGFPEADSLRFKTVGSHEEDRNRDAVISIKEWNPTTPYLTEIKTKSGKEAYAAYLGQRASYATSPAFFFDCANYFMKSDPMIAFRILSNLGELKLDNPSLLRAYAWRLQEAGELDLAIDIMSKVRKLRPEEPQSHRDLALMLSLRLDRDKTIKDGVKAVELLNQVILGSWVRFEEIEVIALMELNRVLWAMERIDRSSLRQVKFVDDRLRKLLDLDVRITMSWDADATDMDLHVIEPSGEEAFYGHKLTAIGGLVSRDFTQGYGPEEYIVRKAIPGAYKIRAKYFGSRQQTLLGPVTATATVITNFGRPNEKRQVLTLRLSGAKDMVDIGEINFGDTSSEKQNRFISSTLTHESLKVLKRGMNLESIVNALGPPERQDGGALKVLLYRLADGQQIRIGVGPNLIWVKKIHEGAEIELDL